MKTFELRDLIALALIPVQILARWLIRISPMAESQAFEPGIMFALALAAMVVLVILYKDVLADDFARFRKKLWLKILICVAGAVAAGVIVHVARMIFVPSGAENGEAYAIAENDGPEIALPFVLSLLLSFVPLLVVFQEEIVFRHALFYKHKANKILAAFLFVLSAVLFGLIHFDNFGGDLIQTVPYMFAGAFFGLVYLVGKNIWFAIGAHFVFNFVLGFLPGVFLLIANLFVN